MDSFRCEMSKFLAFRDKAVCERVRKIKRADICNHPNKNVHIKIIEQDDTFSFAFLLDIVTDIKRSLDEGKKSYVMILPATNPYYAWVAEMLNRLRIPCHHVHTFNMDEYADENGQSAPRDWPGGFQYNMWRDFFDRIDPKLRMPENQIHFPLTENMNDYSKMLEDLGGADVCYGGIGWCGHLAFIEPCTDPKYSNDMDAFLKIGTGVIDLHPLTVCQNSLSDSAGASGDWSWHPPKAITIGPRDIAGSKRVSSWNNLRFGDAIWQRSIARLALYGPVTPLVPASMLQILNSEVILSGAIAADITYTQGALAAPIKFPDFNWQASMQKS